jgi:hypothetical protein
MEIVQTWLNDNYNKIIKSAKNISKGIEWEDLAHYAIEQFLENPRAEEIVQNGGAQFFIVRIMLNSHNSSTSHYHTLYRQKNRFNSLDGLSVPELHDGAHEQEELIQKIETLIEQANNPKDPALWYRIKLLVLYSKTPNYSELSRVTGIPRTSIAQAIKEAREWIITNLDNYHD